MAALDFPASPSTNDIHTENGASWKWNGSAWTRLGDVGAQGAAGAAGAAGAQGAQGVQGAAGAQGAAGSGTATADKIFEGNTSVEVVDTGSDGKIEFATEGTDRWNITNAGHILPQSNASYDIGSADLKVRHLFLSDSSLKFVDSADTVRSLSLDSDKSLKYPGGLNLGSNIKIGAAGVATASNFKTGTTNVHNVGVEAAGINVLGADTPIGTGATIYNSGAAVFTGVVTATSFSGSGADLTGITAGYWGQDSVGLNTVTSVGVNTSTINDKDIQGIGNTFNGMYISNGMMIYDNALSGNHYIGTAFNGLMAGPVTIHGTLSVDGQYVVV